MSECLGCEISAGRAEPPGGVLWRDERFVLHAVAGPTPVPGWLVLTSVRHCRAVYSLDEAESAQLGVLAARFSRLLVDHLGAEHVYVFAIGDVLQHCHVHLIPRYAQTPTHLRGRGAFDAQAAEQLPAEEVLAAVARVRLAL